MMPTFDFGLFSLVDIASSLYTLKITECFILLNVEYDEDKCDYLQDILQLETKAAFQVFALFYFDIKD